MAVKLRPGSMELELAYIEWLRAQGYNPLDGMDSFFSESDFVRSQLMMIHESEQQTRAAEAREHLRQRTSDPVFSAQFPMVYSCLDEAGAMLRYTVTLTMSDKGAEWVGRVWNGSEYLGEIRGEGSGPHSNYVELARMHIESQIKCPGVIKRERAAQA
ncbi:MAG TPA: hypothetical protein VEY92_04400 [Pseudoxanthomonas sp.]|nr:hypothetical protein [Pseudoxanthomonas sp.]